MLAYSEIEEEIINDDIFSSLLKKETWFKNIFLNTIYLQNSIWWVHWSYYVYFYSKKLNICYINDLNFYCSKDRQSVTNNIEKLSSLVLPHIKIIQGKNTRFHLPSFVYFYNQWYNSTNIIRQKIKLKPIFDNNKNLVWFYQPDWTAWNDIINIKKLIV